MESIETLFSHLDRWRHFPNYQLERRADLLFSLYLPQALEAKFDWAFQDDLLPEFPVRIGTISPQTSSNQSYKIDYLALSADRQLAVLVELKTDDQSRRTKQDAYLSAAKRAGLPALLEGLKPIFQSTNAKRKYFHLLVQAEHLGLIRLPAELRAAMNGASLLGASAAAEHIKTSLCTPRCEIIYLQPRGEGADTINFHQFRASVAQHDDAVSKRFAQSLARWATDIAGEESSFSQAAS